MHKTNIAVGGLVMLDYFAGNDFIMAGTSKNHLRMAAHKPLYYGVQYNHAGKMWLRVDKEHEYIVEGPWAFITHPGAFFEYGSVNEEARYHNYICFTGPRAQHYIDGGLMNLNPDSHPIKISHPDRFLQTMHKITGIVFGGKNDTDRAVLALEDLLLQLHEQNRDNLPKPHQQPFLSTLASSIRTNPEIDRDFSQIASELNISDVHFRRLFKQYCGLAPRQFLIQQRLRKAAELLVNTSELIRNIAYAVGIENEYYFSRLFKKVNGISPERYRNEFAGSAIQ